MADSQGFVGELLGDPAIMEQVQPLLNAAIDARIEPMRDQLEKLTHGVTLIAQATVEQAAQPPPPPPDWRNPQPVSAPVAQSPAPNGAGPYQPAQPTAAVDKLAQFAPFLMQCLSAQGGSSSLGSIAETLSAAAQIGNVMNAPLYQGMKMATDMMSMAGRAGIEPVTAAAALGGMIDGAATPNTASTPPSG